MSNIKTNKARKCALLRPALFMLLSALAVYGQGSMNAHLRAPHREFVNKFLSDPQSGMGAYRVATERDCTNKAGLREVRGNLGKGYHPYYAAGDFDRNGVQDFAVVFVKKAGRAMERFKIVIFEGTPAKTFVAKWNSDDMAMHGMGLFYTEDHGLYYGGFEAEDCIKLKPSRGGYAEEGCNDN